MKAARGTAGISHGELTGDGPLLAEALEIFQRLEASPWLARVAAAQDRTPDKIHT